MCWWATCHCQAYRNIERCTKMVLWLIFVASNSKMYFGLHVRCVIFLSDFNRIWIRSTDFHKSSIYHISQKSVQRQPCHYVGWTWRSHRRFLQLCNLPKKLWKWAYSRSSDSAEEHVKMFEWLCSSKEHDALIYILIHIMSCNVKTIKISQIQLIPHFIIPRFIPNSNLPIIVSLKINDNLYWLLICQLICASRLIWLLFLSANDPSQLDYIALLTGDDDLATLEGLQFSGDMTPSVNGNIIKCIATLVWL